MARMLKLTDHFHLKEFRCTHCGKVEVSYVIPYLLEKTRLWAGSPIIITSGYRCPEYNERIGGVPDSLHTTGRAVDIISPGHTSQQLAVLAFRAGFYTCIYYPKQGHTHCQLRGKAKRGLYLHTPDNKYVYKGEPE